MLELVKEYPIFVPYIAIISAIAIFTTIKDKIAAIMDRRRTPEKKLMLISALGGSCAMLLTMFLIRHKTRHAKFMIGVPIMITVQIIIICYLDKLGVLF